MSDINKEQLQDELFYVDNQLASERQKGVEGDQGKITQFEQKRTDIIAQLEGAERQQITQKQEEHNGGLKEVIYQVFDAVIPADAGSHAFGINDFQEKGETFRQLIDIAVDDNNHALNAYIAELLESKDAKIREQNALIIDLGVKLQESERKEQYSTENYDRAVRENERLESEFLALSNASADKDVENADLQEQLKAKDEQIAKLTEEINKPKASGIILPNQARPSATLQQLMEEAKNKSVKSQMEIALAGQAYRGKVELTPPALGGSHDSISFPSEDTQGDIGDGGVSIPKAPSLTFRPEEEDGHGVDEGNTGLEVAESPVSRKEFEELKKAVDVLYIRANAIEERVVA